MQFGDLIPLTGALLNLSLALFVAWQNPRATVSRVYLLLGLSLAVWNYGTFWMFRVRSHDEALFWARFLQCGVIFIPFALFHISYLIANLRIPLWVTATVYALHGLLFASNFTSFFVADVKNVGYAWYAIAGPGFWIFVGVFSLMWVSVGVLLRHRRNLPPLSRRRITPLITAQGAIAIFGCNDALPILGIYQYPATNVQIYPFGSMAAIFYGTIVGYSVLQHQLLDVRVTLSRSTAKVVRLLFIFLAGLFAQLVFWLLDKSAFNYYSFFAGLATLMVGSVCAAVLFPRLFGETSEVLERRILGDTFEYQDQVRSFIQNIYWYNDMQTLLDDLEEVLTATFRLKGFKIILRDETTRVFSIMRSSPSVAARELDNLKMPSPIFQYFEWGRDAYLSLRETLTIGSKGILARQAREQLHDLDAQFCFALSSQNEAFGLFLVDEKISGEPYTATDINLLVLLVKNLSLMINQIRLKTQILQNQELDLLGRMSRGMAHDLNNLLTPVWTLLQLSSEEPGSNTFDEDLLPVALRNIKTMRAYIKEALFFSENLRPDFQLGRLDMLVTQASDLAKASRKKQIDVIAQTAGEVLVEIDEVLFQRMIANLVANAIDASAPGSEVRVELTRLAKTEANRDWVRVQIRDCGEGIRKEDLNRVFTPYFTTKNRGDENRGFGLGLAICRKIVNLHGGNLSIASQLKKGTTVQVDIPTRQIKPVQPPVAASA